MKIIDDLKLQGINFYEDKEFDNVIFEKDGEEYKIYKELFYRITGASTLIRTDEDFYKMQKSIILYNLTGEIVE